ncbi:ATP-binding cassette domain-containing protein [Humidisolicoccus flavus]|uniref:ATP-binding cassette domain-containing protein n=1 Tax=Humidisolicoccus flavus TaxID=3111414 RepID=UPI0032513951
MTAVEPTEPLLVVDDLTVSVSRRAIVQGVTFRVEPGEFIAVLGTAGSGTSTLLSILADGTFGHQTAAKITGGDARLLGVSLRKASLRKKRKLGVQIGALLEGDAAALPASETVFAVITEELFAIDKNFDLAQAQQHAALLLDLVHLPIGLLEQRVFRLSSGQRQRVALAKALVVEPQFVIADKPGAGIDSSVRASLLRSLAALTADGRVGGILGVGSIAEARIVTSKLLVLDRGQVIAAGTPDEIAGDRSSPAMRALNEAESTLYGDTNSA